MGIRKTLMIAAGAIGLAAALAGSAQAYTVDVGYADTLRPAGFFPNPWVGGTGVVSADPFGCASSGDCGAIGIDNRTGGSSLSVNLSQFSINFSSNVGNLNTTLVVPGGDFGIFVLDDSSDVSAIPGADSTHPALGCTGTSGTNPNPAQTCPSFVLAVNGGTPTTYFDSGHVLDTNGWDEGGANETEAFQWRAVGTSGTHGGDVPEPLTLSLFGAGLAGAIAMRRRRKGKSA